MPLEPDTLEKLHADALAELVAILSADGAVVALVPEQVFGPDADSLARAEEWGRCVLVTPGKRYGPPAGPKNLLVQRDAKVEMRAENQAALDLLAVAVVGALRGAVGRSGFQNCVHSNSTPSRDGPGDPPAYLARVDTFALHCVQPAQKEAEKAMGLPPPARVSGMRPGPVPKTPPAALPRVKPPAVPPETEE